MNSFIALAAAHIKPVLTQASPNPRMETEAGHTIPPLAMQILTNCELLGEGDTVSSKSVVPMR